MASLFLVQHTSAGDVQFPDAPPVFPSLTDTAVYATPTASASGMDFYVQTVWTRNGTDSNSPYVYNLLSTSDAHIPRRPVYTVRTRSLAAVHNTYAAQGTGAAATASEAPILPGNFLGATGSRGFGVGLQLPGTANAYFTPGRAGWLSTLYAGTDAVPGTTFGGYRYSVAGTYRHAWNAAPIGPTFPVQAVANTYTAERTGNTITALLPLYGDAASDHASDTAPYGADSGVTGSTTLYRNGAAVESSAQPGYLATRKVLPAGAATYKITTQADRTVRWSRYATRERITWKFRSGHTGTSHNLPLLAVRYSVALDRFGRAPVGKPHTVTVRLQEHNTADHGVQSSLRVRASYDDGKTWRPVATRTADGHSTFVLTPPKSALYVSLRATAADNNGNTVDQTVIRAYGLRGVKK